MTDEAEKSSDISTVDGKVPGDYSTSGVDTIAEFLNNMDLQPKEKVLDYGCGLGRFLIIFLKEANTTVLIYQRE